MRLANGHRLFTASCGTRANDYRENTPHFTLQIDLGLQKSSVWNSADVDVLLILAEFLTESLVALYHLLSSGFRLKFSREKQNVEIHAKKYFFWLNLKRNSLVIK